MARIFLKPARADIGTFREQYDALIRELEEAGHSVLVEREIEYRGGGAEIGQMVFNVIVEIASDVEDEAIGAIIALLALRLRGTLRGRPRRAQVIWGPRGEHLRKIELPPDES